MASTSGEIEIKKGNLITRSIERLVTYMGLTSSGIVMVILFFIVAETLSRAAFNKPFKGVVEAGGFMLVLVVFLGIAYVQLRKGHIRVDFIIARFPPRVLSLHFMLESIIILAIFSLIGYFGAQMTIHAYEVGELAYALPFLPVWIIRMSVPFGSFLVVLLVVSELVQEIGRLIRTSH